MVIQQFFAPFVNFDLIFSVIAEAKIPFLENILCYSLLSLIYFISMALSQISLIEKGILKITDLIIEKYKYVR